MRFDQAFYTRDAGIGLRVVASSDPDIGFRKKCLAVGSKFETEPAEETAQFVYYSEDFGRYVGVGVSPASYADGTGANKLVHIWIPQEETEDPSEYYLAYPFDRTVDRERRYESCEWPPVLSDGDMGRILEQYRLDQTKLAGLLSKIVPVVFMQKNLLTIVISGHLHEKSQYPDIARELTWLMARLVPMAGKERARCLKNLSYAVFSSKNIPRVNVAYVDQKEIHDNYFLLDEPYSEPLPELFIKLADMALLSPDEYDRFIRELFAYRLDRAVDIPQLNLMLLQWQMEHGKRGYKKKELPLSIGELIKNGQKDFKYRALLYGVVSRVDDLSELELAKLSSSIFRLVMQQIPEESLTPPFLSAYERAIRLSFEKNDKIYRIYIRDTQGELQKTVLTNLWEQGAEGTCIRRDWERIASAEEGIERLQLYQGLWKNPGFLSVIRTVFIDGYYFQMKRENRKYVSGILSGDQEGEGPSWQQMIRDQIQAHFRENTDVAFLEQEAMQAETEYIPLYFSCFLQNLRKNPDVETRSRLQRAGRLFMKQHRDLIDGQDCAFFVQLDRSWIREELRKQMEGMSLKELSGLTDFGDSCHDYGRDLRIDWCHEILSRLGRGAMTEELLEALVGRQGELAALGEEELEAYRNRIWEVCGDNMKMLAYCSVMFDVSRFSVWEAMAPCRIKDYKVILSVIENERGYGYAPIESICVEGTVSEAAEWNRQCYRLWKRIHQKKQTSLTEISELNLPPYRKMLESFLEDLQEELLERLDRQACIDYLRIGLAREGLWADREPDVEERCASYRELKETHPEFYARIVGTAECPVAEYAVREREKEMKIFCRLDTRPDVGQENLEEMASLLYQSEAILGGDTALVRKLEEEYTEIMKELKQEQDELQRQIDQDTIAYNQTLEEIKKLKKKADELGRKLAEKMKRRDKLKRQRDTAQSNRNGGKADPARNNRNGGKPDPVRMGETAPHPGRPKYTADADEF